MKTSLKLALSSTVLLAACVTPPPPPEAAALDFAPTAKCTDGFVQETAIDMTPEEPQGYTVRRGVLDNASACLTSDGAAVPYALYRLPSANNTASVQAGSIFEPARILGAHVHFLDADLRPTRSYGAGDMLHRGSTLSVLVRPRESEAYVAIVADRELSYSAYDRSRPEDGNGKANDRIPYSLLGRSFVRVYYYDPTTMLPES